MSIRIDGTNTTANPGITGSDTDTGLQFGTNEVKVVTDGTAQATLDNSGNLLFTQEAASSPYPQQQIKWSNDSTTENGFYISQDTSRNGRIWHEQGLEILFGTNNTERMRILAAGGLTFNGDTAAANALDDYEEGTFTPTINSGFTASYDSQAGRYTKVGNVVHFFINIDLSSISGSSSDTYAEVRGLPFTATNTGNIDNAVTVAWQMNLGNSVEYAYIEQNATSIVLLGEPSGGSRTHWNPGQVWDDNNGKLALSGTYTTTA